MRTFFPGFYSLRDEQIEELWNSAVLVLDTNVLLDLYRVSPETQSDLLSLLCHFGEQGRLWIPYQVAFEYHDDLYGVVFDQMKKYDDTLKILNDFLGSISQKRNHPFLDDSLIRRVKNLMRDIEKYFNSQKQKLKHSSEDSSLKGKIADFFDGKIGTPFSEQDLNNIYADGKQRYAKKIPPGYEDQKKGEPGMYKDLILWKEILKYSKENDVSIIFVSSDTKEDWYLIKKGKTICPHPQLIKEFQDETGQKIILYSLERFMGLAKEKNVVTIQDDSIEEVKSKDISTFDTSSYMEKVQEILKNVDANSGNNGFNSFRQRMLQHTRFSDVQHDLSDLILGSTSSTSASNVVENNESDSALGTAPDKD